MDKRRRSGILLHPSSLPGPHGSGDLGPAARHFVDWLLAAGQSLWQMLPVGAVGAGNSPYVSSSAFAGNPLLVDLDELAQRGWLAAEDLVVETPPPAARIDYDWVRAFRMPRLARAAERFRQQASAAEREEFLAFCRREAGWLDDYALFMALDAAGGGQPWQEWPIGLARRAADALAAARATHAGAIAFWQFVQWCFDRQWTALHDYARRHGVELVGDVPIFIALQSAEVWARQDLFELDGQGWPTVVAGVPPDYFSATGQRWGNPLYRWPAHAEDGYSWWIARIRHAFARADVVRIDHFRGFAGYWEIPASEPSAIHGCWKPGPGAPLFEAIERALGTPAIIAEDLGVLTPDVLALRDRFDLPGMRILQFAFGGDASNSYLPHWHIPNCVVYTGTHDNDTTAGWWATATEHERAFAAAWLGTDGSAIHWDLMRAASASVAQMAIFPLQDVLGLGSAHRMNFPGQASGHWEWRFEWSQLAPEHAQRLAQMAAAHGRAAFRLDP